MVELAAKLWEQRWYWVLVASVAGLSAGAIIVFTNYRMLQPVRLTSAAQKAMANGDHAQAEILARRALEINERYVPAFNVIAELCEQERNPDAMIWRERAVKLSKGSVESLVAYASTALNYGQKAVARTALARIGEAERQRADVQAAFGAVALNAENYPEAARYYSEAARLAPHNAEYSHPLGRAQAMSGDSSTREAGRRLLAGLTADPEFGVPAMRSLVASYQASEELEAALRESRKLVARVEHAFSDDLLHLHLLRRTGAPEFAAALGRIQSQTLGNPKDAAALLDWMRTEGLAAAAVEWAVKRFPRVEQMLDVQPALAGCYLQLGNWRELLKRTQRGNWESVEHFRHAYRARALREQDNQFLSRSEWTAAVDATAGQPEAIAWLAQISAEWNWPEEREQVLWKAIENAQNARWALDILHRRYVAEKNTEGLRRVASYLLKADPTNEDARNDFAIHSLLLRQEVDRAYQMSLQLFQKHPDNAAYVSTYAFALHCKKRTAEALQVLQALPPAQLETPDVAAYYGIVLAAMDDHEKARHFLEIARQAPLFPEEMELVIQAMQTAPAKESEPH